MYESHFGLKSNPFGAKTDGAGVFVGPAQNEVIKSLQKGLGAQDAVITLTGPVGVGKTTIITRALQAMSPGRTAAWVGRMQLGANDLTELLLAGFGIQSKSKGPVRRFAAFRRLTQIQADNGAPVAIIVEDAHRVGVDALDELEALTSADSGDTNGANIILMGQPGLHEMLQAPELARLAQRMRLRQKLEPLSTPEIQGYLKHVVRQAGGDFDQLFEKGVVDIVAACSNGIPRMINSVCTTALSAAMENGQQQVSRALLAEVAKNTFGFDYEGDTSAVAPEPVAKAPEAPLSAPKAAPVAAAPAPAAKPAATPARSSKKTADPEELPPAARDVVVESGCYPDTSKAAAPEVEPSIPEAAPDGAGTGSETTSENVVTSADNDPLDDIPEFINDTQPELAQLESETPATSEISSAVESASDASEGTAPQKILTRVAPPAEQEKTSEPVAEAKAAAPEADASSEPAYDLDDVLNPDTDSTNMMKGLTGDLDAVSAAEEETAEQSDELPTLSESMRVHAVSDETTDAVADKPAESTADAEPPAPTEFDDAEQLAAALEAAHQETAQLQALEAGVESDDVPAAALPDAEADAAIAPTAPPDAAVVSEVPEITLDAAIGKPAAESPPAAATPQDKEKLEKFAEEISSASSLEDISELMAETLFGNHDLDQIAAEVAAKPPPEESPVKVDNPVAPAEAEASPVVDTDEVPPSPAEKPGVPPALQQPNIDPVATGEIELTLALDESGIQPAADAAQAKAAMEPAAAATPEAAVAPASAPAEAVATAAASTPQATPSAAPGDGAMDLRESVAMRIEMLNKMNAAASPATPKPAKPKAPPQPEPIEEQITTSMTQTLEALKVSKKAAPPPDDDDDDNEDEKKPGGLFSRFRRSS